MNKLRIEFLPEIPSFNVDLEGDGYGYQFWEKLGSGLYEADTISVIQRFAGPNSVLVDLGAATGAMTLIAASLGFHVVSVEGNREVFECLVRNVQSNPILQDRIKLENVIIAPSCEIDQQSAGNISNRILTEITYSGTGKSAFLDVPLVTLKEILPPIGDSGSVLVKVDLEGAEWALFSCKEFVDLLESKNAVVVVALHPGLNRPWKGETRKENLLNSLKKFIWWRKNIHDAKLFFESVGNFAIQRTNGTFVKSKWKFLALVIGGCHEFLLLPRK